jgi:hypothetical protein
LFKRIKDFFARMFGSGPEEVQAQATDPIITPDFSEAYVPFHAENGKFVAADESHSTFADYPSGGCGKYVMLTYSVNDYDALDFTEPYVPFHAENGKFVKLDVPASLGYPATGCGKYAVLTYNINPPGLSGGAVGGDIDMQFNDILNVNFLGVSSISASCGTSDEWCSTYTTVCANSALWNSAVAGGILSVNGELGPAITINGTAGVSVSTNAGTNSIIISAALPFDSTEIEAASGNWNSTYTTVTSNSAIWDSTYTVVTANSASWAPQNLWATITADSGNTTANSVTDTLYISGGTDITTRIVGDTVAIDYTGADPILNIVRESSTFTLPTSNQVVLVSAVSAIDAILPPANGNSGIIYTIKKIDQSNNFVTLSAAEFIDDDNTYDIRRPYDAIRLISDDIQWWII